MKKYLKIIFYIFIFTFVILIDRITKIWAINNLAHKDISLFRWLDLTLVWNRGVAWGLFSFESLFGFAIVTAIIILFLGFFTAFFYDLLRRGKPAYFEIFILAGAISNNIIDRFIYKGVTDFIDVHIAGWHWPVFNFADMCIVFGVLGFLGRYFRYVYFRKIKRV
jgi:signal peptidase II